ncbi:TIGR03752 family integrating conjugative element protein [Gallibacterium anatis]|uniref:TIGR03752 family integrating conjugative element protein n=1 Tax=Gallibacterium anatis TaxID=750 RepID=A0AAX3XFH8_9PAST|nr:TIGR03752 family integrating conjugative element protein [Gallibacterium anatis]MDK9560782.1 TIGR03752 family integrating conjugative element protein [Gallibacterium anatis]WIM80196.1 TIGR03752 family integrating conjugative element protein [Gallibacterium anatis]
MKLKQNGLLKIIVPSAVAIAVIIGLKVFKSEENATAQTQQYALYDLKPEELRALGIEGDTPQDTIRTLIGTIKRARQDIADVKAQNEALMKKNKTLTDKSESVDEQIQAALAQERNAMSIEFEQALQQRTESLTEELEKRLANLSALKSKVQPSETKKDDANLFAAESGNGEDFPIGNTSGGMQWVMPADMQALDRNGNPVTAGQQAEQFGFPSLFSELDKSALGKAHENFTGKKKGTSAEEKPPVPIYTLPENSTLIGSVAMTALLGRVPIDGVVNDPYPFKVLVGKENLTANGMMLPNVEGAILSGTASGDWTLSCVRGKVMSITLVFNDGRVRTWPQSKRSSSSGNSDGIGWISDPYGVPCVPGDRKTNAPEYLTSNFLLGGVAAAADAYSQSQTTTVTDGASVVSAVTGDQGKYLMGQALGAGLKDTTEWLRKRFGQTFDAIYVPPGHPVAIHLTQSIDIDYEPNGRKVNYLNNNQRKQLD